MKHALALTAILLAAVAACWGAQRYSVTGMVVSVDPEHKSFVASCQSIPGFMPAMTMPFEVRDAGELKSVQRGTTVSFNLVVDNQTAYAEHVQVFYYQSVEQDPLTARRLKLLKQITHPSTVRQLTPGETVPNFTLVDQLKRPVSLAQFRGKVVAINFIYTSCALPNFCFRISNNFGQLQRKFKDHLGRNLILLTVTFDPQRDQPETLARYSQTWRADPEVWRFLTGNIPEVAKVTALFGVDFFPDEGLMNHSLHTAIIDREGKLVTNIEGNQFTSDQLADLVQSVLDESPKRIAADLSRAAGK